MEVHTVAISERGAGIEGVTHRWVFDATEVTELACNDVTLPFELR
jgi:hypothetical protein